MPCEAIALASLKSGPAHSRLRSAHHAHFDNSVKVRVVQRRIIDAEPVAFIERTCAVIGTDDPELRRSVAQNFLQESGPCTSSVLVSEEVDRVQVQGSCCGDSFCRVRMIRRAGECESHHAPAAHSNSDHTRRWFARKDRCPHTAPHLQSFGVHEPIWNETGVRLPPRLDVNRRDPVCVGGPGETHSQGRTVHRRRLTHADSEHRLLWGSGSRVRLRTSTNAHASASNGFPRYPLLDRTRRTYVSRKTSSPSASSKNSSLRMRRCAAATSASSDPAWGTTRVLVSRKVWAGMSIE